MESLYYYRAVPFSMTKSFKKIEQLLGHKVAMFLAEERKLYGIDSIQAGKLRKVEDYINMLKAPYEKDRSLFYHQKAAGLVYSGLYVEAIKEALNAISQEPLKFKNYRLLQYCLRKLLLNN